MRPANFTPNVTTINADSQYTNMNRKRILIVDDDPVFAETLREVLEQTPEFDVRVETSSVRALHAARDFPPDLIITDIVMPGLDGGEFAARIRADHKLRHIPMLFLTGLVSNGEGHGLFSGGFYFLGKPFKLALLHTRIRTLLHCSAAAPPAQPAVAIAAHSAA